MLFLTRVSTVRAWGSLEKGRFQTQLLILLPLSFGRPRFFTRTSEHRLSTESTMEHLVPLRKEDWGFFDRQRSIFSSMFKDMDDEFKEFDRELERMKKEMFQLKVV